MPPNFEGLFVECIGYGMPFCTGSPVYGMVLIIGVGGIGFVELLSFDRIIVIFEVPEFVVSAVRCGVVAFHIYEAGREKYCFV